MFVILSLRLENCVRTRVSMYAWVQCACMCELCAVYTWVQCVCLCTPVCSGYELLPWTLQTVTWGQWYAVSWCRLSRGHSLMSF